MRPVAQDDLARLQRGILQIESRGPWYPAPRYFFRKAAGRGRKRAPFLLLSRLSSGWWQIRSPAPSAESVPEAIGAHHLVRTIAKAARKALFMRAAGRP